jgi:hypothetical protein
MHNHKDRIGNLHTIMDDSDTSTIANICRSAAERFKETAGGFRKLIDHKPVEGEQVDEAGRIFIDMTPHGDAARRLAEQFDRQAAEAIKFAEIFGDADHAEVIGPAEEEEDAA